MPAPAQAASGPLSAGQIKPFPSALAPMAAGRAPETVPMVPSRLSSPRTTYRPSASAGIAPKAAMRPKAIGRSKCDPSLGKSAGARLTVTFFAGSARPEAWSAACTRSRLSATALSGRPTIWMPTFPGATITCTSTGTPSIP
ncbi:hypothetical protein D3C87_1625650 [compost metagenome]